MKRKLELQPRDRVPPHTSHVAVYIRLPRFIAYEYWRPDMPWFVDQCVSSLRETKKKNCTEVWEEVKKKGCSCDLKFIDGSASAHSRKLNTEKMWNRDRSHVVHHFWHFEQTEWNSMTNNEMYPLLLVHGPLLCVNRERSPQSWGIPAGKASCRLNKNNKMSGWSIKTSNLTQQHQEKGPMYRRKRKHTPLAQRAFFSPPLHKHKLTFLCTTKDKNHATNC